MPNKSLLTTGDIARHCQVTQRTVHNWIRTGHLPTSRTPGRHQRIRVIDFEHFLHEHRLPAYGQGASEPAPEPAAEPASGARRRVLVVDDDPHVRAVILRALQRLGKYEVASAADGFTAGLEVGRFLPDVVILDILMPHINGIEACRLIKGDPRTSDTRVLIVSALPEEDFHLQVAELGIDGWLQKPIRMVELVARVSELVNLSNRAVST
jgi:excisionase family DNA binding protein